MSLITLYTNGLVTGTIQVHRTTTHEWCGGEFVNIDFYGKRKSYKPLENNEKINVHISFDKKELMKLTKRFC